MQHIHELTLCMCIIPREIKRMSSGNMHILPKNSVYRAEKSEMGKKVMLKRTFSGDDKHCVCVCCEHFLLSLYLTASCHIMAWLNFSFIVDKTTKTSDRQNIANPMRVFHRSAIDSIFCSVSFHPKIKVVFAKRLQI